MAESHAAAEGSEEAPHATAGKLDWSPVIDVVERSEQFVLTTHVRPDTDGIGSEIALHRYLSSIGKQVRVINPGPPPPNLRMLDPDGVVASFSPADEAFIRDATIVVLDVSERDRLGPLVPLLDDFRGTSVCIDHHINKHRRFADINVIDPAAPATGALVFQALQALSADIDPVIAQALYATIVADTGSFRFSNTTAQVMRLAADLVDLGAEPHKVSRLVLGMYNRPKMVLLGHTLSQLQVDCDDRLTWCVVSRARLDEAAATVEDADGLVEYLRLHRRVCAAVFFVELEDERVKVSFRSEDGYDVNRLAARWGGGGHRHAAGAIIPGPLPEVVDRVIGSARELFT